MKLIILVGFPGAGKSTLAKGYTGQGYVVVNQDTLGDRNKCLEVMRAALTQGSSVVIDRTNINKKQRGYFIEAAKKFKVDVECIVLEVDYNTCLLRLISRENHPTIKKEMPLDKKREILDRFSRDYERPELSEGFTRVTFQGPLADTNSVSR